MKVKHKLHGGEETLTTEEWETLQREKLTDNLEVIDATDYTPKEVTKAQKAVAKPE